jgi:predicted DsbA family dithiol-disulfide isomerase
MEKPMKEQSVHLTVFHDVLCSWCFVASGRLHQIEREYGERVAFTYKAFPLGPTREELTTMFGSEENAKREILTHWAASKRLPGGEEISPEEMADRPFPYPYSMPALRAVKAAEFQGGREAHARMYDRLQRAHLVETRNIADPQILLESAAELGLDLERFKADLESESTLQAVMQDRQEAFGLGISATPTVVLNGKWVLPGAVTVETYRRVIDDLLTGHDPGRRFEL